jgi:hypothetical protein
MGKFANYSLSLQYQFKFNHHIDFYWFDFGEGVVPLAFLIT